MVGSKDHTDVYITNIIKPAEREISLYLFLIDFGG
jgi:hypothetical protein